MKMNSSNDINDLFIDLFNASYWWSVNVLVDQSLIINFCQDASLVVVSQSSSHCLICHSWFVLVLTPQGRNRLAVNNLEDSAFPVEPLDVLWVVCSGLQEIKEKLPKVGTVGVLLLLSWLFITNR